VVGLAPSSRLDSTVREPEEGSAERRETLAEAREVPGLLPPPGGARLPELIPAALAPESEPRLAVMSETVLPEAALAPEPQARPALAHADLAQPDAFSNAYAQAHAAEGSEEITEPLPALHSTSLPTPAELSIPPMGDLSVEPVADRFFAQDPSAGHDDEWDHDGKDHALRKSRPEVIERRARFARYVRWAVGGAAVVCLAAFARSAMTPWRAGSPAVQVAAAAAPLPPDVARPAVVAPPAAAPKAPPPIAASEVPPAAPADDGKTALEEKNDSRRALERGKTADAIDAGERSVAKDPTDGEAWLLLGAAYQDKGMMAEARRAYGSCLKEGKRGPLGECRAMLR
jgi:hypothetical protein